MRKDGVNGDVLIQELIDNGTIGLQKDVGDVNESLESDSLGVKIDPKVLDKAIELMDKKGLNTDYTVV